MEHVTKFQNIYVTVWENLSNLTSPNKTEMFYCHNLHLELLNSFQFMLEKQNNNIPPSPLGSTALHISWCGWTWWCRSSPRGCWRFSVDRWSCSPAPPPPAPAALPWQPAASSAGRSADTCRKRSSFMRGYGTGAGGPTCWSEWKVECVASNVSLWRFCLQQPNDFSLENV